MDELAGALAGAEQSRDCSFCGVALALAQGTIGELDAVGSDRFGLDIARGERLWPATQALPEGHAPSGGILVVVLRRG